MESVTIVFLTGEYLIKEFREDTTIGDLVLEVAKQHGLVSEEHLFTLFRPVSSAGNAGGREQCGRENVPLPRSSRVAKVLQPGSSLPPPLFFKRYIYGPHEDQGCEKVARLTALQVLEDTKKGFYPDLSGNVHGAKAVSDVLDIARDCPTGLCQLFTAQASSIPPQAIAAWGIAIPSSLVVGVNYKGLHFVTRSESTSRYLGGVPAGLIHSMRASSDSLHTLEVSVKLGDGPVTMTFETSFAPAAAESWAVLQDRGLLAGTDVLVKVPTSAHVMGVKREAQDCTTSEAPKVTMTSIPQGAPEPCAPQPPQVQAAPRSVPDITNLNFEQLQQLQQAILQQTQKMGQASIPRDSSYGAATVGLDSHLISRQPGVAFSPANLNLKASQGFQQDPLLAPQPLVGMSGAAPVVSMASHTATGSHPVGYQLPGAQGQLVPVNTSGASLAPFPVPQPSTGPVTPQALQTQQLIQMAQQVREGNLAHSTTSSGQQVEGSYLPLPQSAVVTASLAFTPPRSSSDPPAEMSTMDLKRWTPTPTNSNHHVLPPIKEEGINDQEDVSATGDQRRTITDSARSGAGSNGLKAEAQMDLGGKSYPAATDEQRSLIAHILEQINKKELGLDPKQRAALMRMFDVGLKHGDESALMACVSILQQAKSNKQAQVQYPRVGTSKAVASSPVAGPSRGGKPLQQGMMGPGNRLGTGMCPLSPAGGPSAMFYPGPIPLMAGSGGGPVPAIPMGTVGPQGLHHPQLLGSHVPMSPSGIHACGPCMPPPPPPPPPPDRHHPETPKALKPSMLSTRPLNVNAKPYTPHIPGESSGEAATSTATGQQVVGEQLDEKWEVAAAGGCNASQGTERHRSEPGAGATLSGGEAARTSGARDALTVSQLTSYHVGVPKKREVPSSSMASGHLSPHPGGAAQKMPAAVSVSSAITEALALMPHRPKQMGVGIVQTLAQLQSQDGVAQAFSNLAAPVQVKGPAPVLVVPAGAPACVVPPPPPSPNTTSRGLQAAVGGGLLMPAVGSSVMITQNPVRLQDMSSPTLIGTGQCQISPGLGNSYLTTTDPMHPLPASTAVLTQATSGPPPGLSHSHLVASTGLHVPMMMKSPFSDAAQQGPANFAPFSPPGALRDGAPPGLAGPRVLTVPASPDVAAQPVPATLKVMVDDCTQTEEELPKAKVATPVVENNAGGKQEVWCAEEETSPLPDLVAVPAEEMRDDLDAENSLAAAAEPSLSGETDAVVVTNAASVTKPRRKYTREELLGVRDRVKTPLKLKELDPSEPFHVACLIRDTPPTPSSEGRPTRPKATVVAGRWGPCINPNDPHASPGLSPLKASGEILHEKMDCDEGTALMLIGRQGATVQSMKQKSGARIWINMTGPNDIKVVNVSGPPAAVRSAQQMIDAFLAEKAGMSIDNIRDDLDTEETLRRLGTSPATPRASFSPSGPTPRKVYTSKRLLFDDEPGRGGNGALSREKQTETPTGNKSATDTLSRKDSLPGTPTSFNEALPGTPSRTPAATSAFFQQREAGPNATSGRDSHGFGSRGHATTPGTPGSRSWEASTGTPTSRSTGVSAFSQASEAQSWRKTPSRLGTLDTLDGNKNATGTGKEPRSHLTTWGSLPRAGSGSFLTASSALHDSAPLARASSLRRMASLDAHNSGDEFGLDQGSDGAGSWRSGGAAGAQVPPSPRAFGASRSLFGIRVSGGGSGHEGSLNQVKGKEDVSSSDEADVTKMADQQKSSTDRVGAKEKEHSRGLSSIACPATPDI